MEVRTVFPGRVQTDERGHEEMFGDGVRLLLLIVCSMGIFIVKTHLPVCLRTVYFIILEFYLNFRHKLKNGGKMASNSCSLTHCHSRAHHKRLFFQCLFS